MSTPSVSVIIVNFNAGALLLEVVVEALRSTIPVEVIVCDNGSSDGSLHYLRAGLRRQKINSGTQSQPQSGNSSAGLEEVILIENDANLGFSTANNIAIAKARGEFILLLNPDCIIRPDTLPRMLEVMQRFPRVGMAGCRILNQDGTEQAGCRRQLPTPLSGLFRALNFRSLAGSKGMDLNEQPLPDHPAEVEAISGSFMLLRRSAIDDVGLMDERYFLHCEDLDYCKRFLEKGWKILFVPDVEVVHYKGTCSQSRPVRVEWHKHRGMWRYYRKFLLHKHFPYLSVLVWLGICSRFLLVALLDLFRPLRSVFQVGGNRPDQKACLGVSGVEPSMNWPLVLAGKTVLVTGATGMLGGRLIAALRAGGAKISVLSRDVQHAKNKLDVKGIDLIQADLTLPQTLSGVCRGVDALFHLASYPGTKDDLHIEEDPKHFEVTLEGTRHLIAEAKRSGVKQIVFASSVRASDSGVGLSNYAEAKRQAEILLLESAVDSSLNVSILRFPAIYGSIKHGNIARMISAIDKGRFPPIPEFRNRRSMIHVDDAVRALLMVAQSEEVKGKIYTVTDGESYSTRRLYCSILAALGKPLPAWYLPEAVLRALAYIGDNLSDYLQRPLLINSEVLEKLSGSAEYDGSAFVEEMGFEPYYNMELALPMMVSRFRSRMQRLNNELSDEAYF